MGRLGRFQVQLQCTSEGGFTTGDSGLHKCLPYQSKLCVDRLHSTHMDFSLDAAHTAVPKEA